MFLMIILRVRRHLKTAMVFLLILRTENDCSSLAQQGHILPPRRQRRICCTVNTALKLPDRISSPLPSHIVFALPLIISHLSHRNHFSSSPNHSSDPNSNHTRHESSMQTPCPTHPTSIKRKELIHSHHSTSRYTQSAPERPPHMRPSTSPFLSSIGSICSGLWTCLQLS